MTARNNIVVVLDTSEMFEYDVYHVNTYTGVETYISKTSSRYAIGAYGNTIYYHIGAHLCGTDGLKIYTRSTPEMKDHLIRATDKNGVFVYNCKTKTINTAFDIVVGDRGFWLSWISNTIYSYLDDTMLGSIKGTLHHNCAITTDCVVLGVNSKYIVYDHKFVELQTLDLNDRSLTALINKNKIFTQKRMHLYENMQYTSVSGYVTYNAGVLYNHADKKIYNTDAKLILSDCAVTNNIIWQYSDGAVTLYDSKGVKKFNVPISFRRISGCVAAETNVEYREAADVLKQVLYPPLAGIVMCYL